MIIFDQEMNEQLETLDDKVLVADNIKAVRAFINAEVKLVSEAFAPGEMAELITDLAESSEAVPA